MIAGTNPEFETQLLSGIRIALSRARDFGYPVERMDVTASVSKGICSVRLAPHTDPGTLVVGGTLSLSIDPQTNEVIGVQSGQ
jgi:hypothetical protein